MKLELDRALKAAMVAVFGGASLSAPSLLASMGLLPARAAHHQPGQGTARAAAELARHRARWADRPSGRGGGPVSAPARSSGHKEAPSGRTPGRKAKPPGQSRGRKAPGAP